MTALPINSVHQLLYSEIIRAQLTCPPNPFMAEYDNLVLMIGPLFCNTSRVSLQQSLVSKRQANCNEKHHSSDARKY